MSRALLGGDDHNLLGNRTRGDPHPQYLGKASFTSSGSGRRLNVIEYGAVADDGVTDNGGPFNAAMAALPSTGGTIYVPWQDSGLPYGFATDFVINKSNVTVEIDSGVVLKKSAAATSSAMRAVIQIQGTISATTRNTTANIDENAVTISVTAGDEALFPAGSWIWIEDTKVAAVAIPAECIHGEWNRVHHTSSGSLGLYYPIHDSYTTALTAKVYLGTPIEGTRIKGEGVLTNSFTPTTGTAHGIYSYAAINTHISGIRGENVFNSAFHGARCEGLFVVGAGAKDPPRFDSRGYGFTCYSCYDVLVFGGKWDRLRHAVDFSVFSGKCIGDGQQCWGSATGALNTHSNVRDITFCNFTIDGCYGQNDIGAGVANDWGTAVMASGINIDKESKNIVVGPGIIRNTMLSGVTVDTKGTNDVTLVGLDVSRFNLSDNSAHAGVRIQEQSAGGTSLKGYRMIGCNIHDGKRVGVYWGINDSEISSTHVHDINNGAGVGIGIWVAPSGGSSVARVKLTDVYCYNNVQNGVRLGVNGGAVTVTECDLANVWAYNNTLQGVFLEETAGSNRIVLLRSFSNGTSGLDIQSDSNFISLCELNTNGTYGLTYIAGADNNTETLNNFTGNSSGDINDLGAGNTRPLNLDASTRDLIMRRALSITRTSTTALVVEDGSGNDRLVVDTDSGTTTINGPDTSFQVSSGEAEFSGGAAFLGGDFRLDRRAVTGNFLVTITDTYIASLSGGAARAITLPAANANPEMVAWIKDASYDAATWALTITPGGGDTVENAATLVLNLNGASVALISDGGTNWEVFG